MSDYDVDVLGIVPEVLRIALTLDANWSQPFELSEDWPEGVTLTIELENGMEWEATLDGPMARFDVDKAVTDTVAQGTGWKFFYRDDDDGDECWFYGTVQRYDRAV